jgi:radical SAM superfamily enzyme YgiQ (UPF0313 family)
MKFLLINPTADCWRIKHNKKPSRVTRFFRYSMLTSLYVAAATPSHVDIKIVDEDVEPVDFDTDIDLVGISFMTYNAPRAYEIADRFRKDKGKTVIFGGYHPSFLPEEAIKYADAICIGEAENNLPNMIKDFETGKLKQFYQSEQADLKGLPIPNRKLLNTSSYIYADAVQATRGCSNKCKFCSISSFFEHNFRARPVDEVVEELKTLRKLIIFMDDNLINDRDYAEELFTKMIPLKKHWFSQCSIKIAFDDKLLKLAHDSGCHGLFLGLESLSQDNLNSWSKGNNAQQYTLAINKIHSANIAVFAAIVFGMDSDTTDIFLKTLNFLQETHVEALQATIMTPFPGTPLFEEMDRQGRIVTKDWSQYDFGHVVFEPKNMSRASLRYGHDWVLSEFYSQSAIWRRLVRVFSYINPLVVLYAIVPLNIGYRTRLITNHAIRDFKINQAVVA